MADNGYQTPFHGVQGGTHMVVGTDANGLPAVIFAGISASDVEIVAEVGADTLWADGSLYIEVKDGAGKLWQKQNDVWVDLQV